MREIDDEAPAGVPVAGGDRGEDGLSSGHGDGNANCGEGAVSAPDANEPDEPSDSNPSGRGMPAISLAAIHRRMG